MRIKQVPLGHKFIYNNKVYIHSLHGRSGGGKVAVRNITDNCEELLDGRLECSLTNKVPELKILQPIPPTITETTKQKYTFRTIFDNLIKWFKEII